MSVEIGNNAEDIATSFVESRGGKIIARNWRNRWCEIDIVAKVDGSIRFIEVKYRKQIGFGTPLEYITADKINRLKRASLAWIQVNGYRDAYQIDVIGVVGKLENPNIEWLENAIFD